ncbi:hypothetical protein GCM10023078_05780 [Gibbsiella greigii]
MLHISGGTGYQQDARFTAPATTVEATHCFTNGRDGDVAWRRLFNAPLIGRQDILSLSLKTMPALLDGKANCFAMTKHQ